MASHFETNGYRTINFGLKRSAIRELRNRWKRCMDELKPYPSDSKGRGIVMCAGGLQYFTCCWIAVKMLRDTGCRLPVELWYSGKELSSEARERIKEMGVTCRDITENDPAALSGCMLKPWAMIKSGFEDILFLDADNVCLKDPAYLFETKEYMDHGAIFWPDFWKTHPGNPIWKITETAYLDSYEQESGQIAINKKRCWAALNLALHFNRLSNVYHRLLLGDKDTFRFAWYALRQPFYMIEEEVSSCGYLDGDHNFLGTTMVQHGTDKDPLFMHRNLLKWDITHSGESVWQIIKKFNPGAKKRSYHILHSDNGHLYMDLEGDIEEEKCNQHLRDTEEECLRILDQLREEAFYKRFLLYLHFVKHRH